MDSAARQTTHPGLRGFAHLLEEMRNHLPRRPSPEPRGRMNPPPVSAVNAGEAMKISRLTPSV